MNETKDIILDGIKEEDLLKIPVEEKPSKWKKAITITLTIFMILLVLSYVWVSYGIDDIVASLMESKTLEENKIRINDTSYLIFEKGTYSKLLEEYLKNQDKEFKACLAGEIKGDYKVSSIVIPEMAEQSFSQVISKSCPEGTIAELHSQPYRKCIESEQDIKTKKLTNKPERLMVIMCEKYRFNFY
ncbi:MAG: hypothetical protein Q8N77_00030 [Nanoarchaeota archaeon]|nr:hypothetical protein [Nanoarchaeota archaeon]